MSEVEVLPEDVKGMATALRVDHKCYRAADLIERLARDRDFWKAKNADTLSMKNAHYEAELTKAQQRIKELESANLSVAVCAQHVEDIRQGDCVICELESLQRQLDEALGALQRGPKMLPATGMGMIDWNREQAQRIEELEEDLRRQRIYAINCKLRNVDPSVDEVHAELFKVQRQLDEALKVMVEQPHFPEMEAQRIREMENE